MRCSVVGVQLAVCSIFFFVSNVAPAGNTYDIPDEDFKRFKSLFIKVGKAQPLGKEEFRKALQILDIKGRVYSDADLDFFYEKAGKNSGEPMNEEEFLTLCATLLKERDPEETLEAMFLEYDRQNKGKVGPQDIRKTVEKKSKGKKMSVGDAKLLVKTYDSDNDGYLDLKDFKRAIRAVLKWPEPKSSEDGSSSSR